jgi:patatin-like phospholipase/acyl hydrolase
LMVFPDLFEKVNFWVGTSNGGMLAMAFAFGYSPALCRTLLELAGTKVFIKRYPAYPPPFLSLSLFPFPSRPLHSPWRTRAVPCLVVAGGGNAGRATRGC